MMPLKMTQNSEGVFSNFEDVIGMTEGELEALDELENAEWGIVNDVPYLQYHKDKDQIMESIAAHIEENSNRFDRILGTSKTSPSEAIEKIGEFFDDLLDTVQTKWTPIDTGLMAFGPDDNRTDYDRADKRYRDSVTGWTVIKP